jgi:predicted transcriptional regulator
MRVTAVEFAEAQGVKQPVASAILKFLEGKGAAKVVEKRPAKGGKGRSSNVYEMEDRLTVTLV